MQFTIIPGWKVKGIDISAVYGAPSGASKSPLFRYFEQSLLATQTMYVKKILLNKFTAAGLQDLQQAPMTRGVLCVNDEVTEVFRQCEQSSGDHGLCAAFNPSAASRQLAGKTKAGPSVEPALMSMVGSTQSAYAYGYAKAVGDNQTGVASRFYFMV